MIVIVANKEGINQIDNKNNGSYIIASGYGLVVSITIGNAGCGIKLVRGKIHSCTGMSKPESFLGGSYAKQTKQSGKSRKKTRRPTFQSSIRKAYNPLRPAWERRARQ